MQEWINWRPWSVSKIMFAEDAWSEYLYWQAKDKGTVIVLQYKGHYDDK